MPVSDRLDRAFFSRPTDQVAVDLLGCTLVSVEGEMRLSGRIVETEAYLGQEDLASHAAIYQRGRETLSQPPGTVYMYRAYGIHTMFNIVSRADAPYGAILIRAVEPGEGAEIMMERRRTSRLRDLASGPGKLCQAFGFTLDDQLRDIATDSRLWIEPGQPVERVCASPRIGITRSPDLILRFFDPASDSVSGHRRGVDWPLTRDERRSEPHSCNPDDE